MARQKRVANEYYKYFYLHEKDKLKNNPEDVLSFFSKISELQVYIMSRYMLTQPQRFYDIEKEFKQYETDPNNLLLATNGRSLTHISELRYAELKYLLAVRAGKKPDIVSKKTIDNLAFLNWGYFGGDVINDDYLKAQIESKTPTSIFEAELSKLDELSRSITKRNALLKVKSVQKEYILADIVGHMSVLRFNMQTYTLCVLNFFKQFESAIVERFNLTEAELNSYELDEICNLIRTGKKTDPKVLEARQRGFLMILNEKGSEIYTGEEALAKHKDVLEARREEIVATKSLKGTIASWPDKSIKKIQGKVFVLTTSFDSEEKVKAMKEGEILVATQTHPNIVPKMKDALAIITDEGGITCHAAIVSRELNKPCIIGTKLATKFLKTGDIIEINFEKGHIVKILK